MKRITSLLLTAVLLCTMLSVFAVPASAMTSGKLTLSGGGTKDNPYKINTIVQLFHLAEETNNGNDFKDMYFKLQHPVILEEMKWVIGTKEHPFRGHFDGGENFININIKAEDSDYVGLFGYVEGSNIKNIRWSGNVSGKNYVGGICGYMDGGSITNCKYMSEDDIYNNYKIRVDGGGSITGCGDYIGGICGYANNATISDCDNSFPITALAKSEDYEPQYCGGICGSMEGNISNCFNTGDVFFDKGSISIATDSRGSYMRGAFFAGICGQMDGTISNCFNTGTVKGQSFIGGIVGFVEGTGKIFLISCSNSGTLEGYSHIGGLCGSIHTTNNTLLNCVSSGTILGANIYCGGLVGYIAKIYLRNCISVCTFNSMNSTNYASLCITYNLNGDVDATNVYFDLELCSYGTLDKKGHTALNYLGRSTSGMKSDGLLKGLNDYVDGYTDQKLLHWVRGEDGYPTPDYSETEVATTGSVLSQGNIWIIIAVAVVAVGGVAALVIVKKKKKPALASGAENTDEE